MKVLISGVGVAGPALAHWLLRHGCDVTMVEEAPALRSGGYIIDFWGTGYDVAERMGLLPRLHERGYHVREVRLVDAAGGRAGGFSADVFSSATHGRFVSIPRGELSAALFESIADHVEVRWGETIRGLVQHDGGVRVAFRNGPSREFDLVIGADGLHSNIRRLTFGAQGEFETYLGYKVAVFEAAGYLPRDEDVYVCYGEPGRQVARFSMRGDRTMFMFVFLDESSLEPEGHDVPSHKQLLHRRFGTLGWECPQILEAMDEVEHVYLDRVSQVRMRAWSNDRVTLIGDAAACPSLLAGEGSALAMTSAYVLAGELARAGGNWRVGFARHESVMRPFLAAKQQAAERFAASFAPRTQLGLALRNLVTRSFGFAPLANLFLGRSLRDEFTLPEYDESVPLPATARLAPGQGA